MPGARSLSILSKNPDPPVEIQTDCLIIGAGTAGLTAAVYLARFHRSVTVLDGGESRAARIPLSHNILGMAEGLSGHDLLNRHLEQAAVYGVTPRVGTVRDMTPMTGGGFIATVDNGSGDELRIEARTVLVATGVRDREPALPWNVAMAEMRDTGFMHNHLRMYWGKKILEWSATPEEGFQRTLRINNRYFLNSRDPNYFTNVGWIYGLHDRPWARRSIFGTVRYQSENSIRKIDAKAYEVSVQKLCQKEKQ